jgi:hypothetical protein
VGCGLGQGKGSRLLGRRLGRPRQPHRLAAGRGHDDQGGPLDDRCGPLRDARRAVRALPPAGGSVYVPAGSYDVHDLSLGAGVHLVGAGPSSVLHAPSRSNYTSVLQLSGADASVSNLTIDANGPAQSGGQGWAVQVRPGANDALLQRLAIENVRSYGVYLWGAHQGVSLQDSAVTGAPGASAGYLDLIGDDASGDDSVLRTSIAHFRDYGVNFYPRVDSTPHDGPRAVASRNTISDIDDPGRDDGTNEAGIWSGGVDAFIHANRIDHTGWDGIETFNRSYRTHVIGNSISATGRGIYVEHDTNDAVFSANTISSVPVGINIEWWYGGHGSLRQTITGNTITGASEYGVLADVGATDNRITQNTIQSSGDESIKIRSLRNVVSDNDLRYLRGSPQQRWCFYEENGRWEDGSLAVPDYNTVTGNDCRGSVGSVNAYGRHDVVSGNQH